MHILTLAPIETCLQWSNHANDHGDYELSD